MDIRQHPQFGTWSQRVQTQPSWVVKTALALAVLVVVVPLVLLTLAAAVVGLVAFVVLGIVANVVGALREVFGTRPHPPMPRGGGRVNVRVIDE